MATSFKTPGGCLTSSWNKAVDAGKFQFRSGSKSTIMELDPAGGGLAEIVNDSFLNDPEINRTTELDWQAGDNLIWDASEAVKYRGSNRNEDAAYYQDYPARASIILEANVQAHTTYSGAYIERAGVMARLTLATGECYVAYLEGAGASYSAFMKIAKRSSGGAYTVLASSAPIARADYVDIIWKLKFHLVGTTLKLMYWKSGDSPPAEYQLEVEDSDNTTGYFGYYLHGWRSDGAYSTVVRIYDIRVTACSYASDSPLRFCEWDSGQNGTTWADTLRIKHNVASSDSGSVKVRVGYSDTQPSTLSEAACDALLGDLKTPDENGDVTGVGGTGCWRVVAFQYDSDGTQQVSVAIFDEGQTVTLSEGGGDAPGIVECILANTSTNSVTLRVSMLNTPLPESIKIAYRLWEGKNADSWSHTSAITSFVVGTEIEVTGLSNGTVYEFIPYGYSSGDVKSSEGPILRVAPSSAFDAALEQIKTELVTNLTAFGALEVYFGRRIPKDRKSPSALVKPLAKIEKKSTNVAILNEYQMLVVVGTDKAELKTGETELLRVMRIADNMRHHYNNNRDFAIANLQLVKASVDDIERYDREDMGYASKMSTALLFRFWIWEASRKP